MKFIKRTEQIEPETAANRTFIFEEQLADAAKMALAPLADRINEYASETARLAADVAKWSPEAYQRRLDGLRRAAASGDPEAVKAVENGTLPSPAAYAAMHNHAIREEEAYRVTNVGLFREVHAVLKDALPPIYAAGQKRLDETCDGLGIPRFKIASAENRIGYLLQQVELAGQVGSLPDIGWLFDVV